MGKGYYIVGSVLLGVGVFLLYNKIKNGNANYNVKNEDNVAQSEDGSHLSPPMEAPTSIPPLATPPIV
jgi:hypothetical protein